MGFGLRHRAYRDRRARDPDRARVGGVGGSFAYADTATGVAFALTKNRLTPDFGVAQQIDEIVTKAVADG